MTLERKLALTRLGAYTLFIFALVDSYVSLLSHADDGMNGRSYLNFDVLNPKPETYNTLAMLAMLVGSGALAYNYTRLQSKAARESK